MGLRSTGGRGLGLAWALTHQDARRGNLDDQASRDGHQYSGTDQMGRHEGDRQVGEVLDEADGALRELGDEQADGEPRDCIL